MKFWLPAYALLISAFLLLAHEWARLPDGKLHLTMFDVGQGDAMLITTPGNQRIVIDGGPNLRLLEHLGAELPFFQKRIDLLILSHTDADHVRALPEVLRRYNVQNVLMTGVVGETSIYSAFLEAVRESGARVILANANNDLDLGEGVFLDVLWPTENVFGRAVKDPNAYSVVAKLTWQDHDPTSPDGLRRASILLTGDIEDDVEIGLFKEGFDLHADILKVPHHGSKTSSSTGFLLAVAPEMALVSVGKGNPYGHPHKQVLARYEHFDIPVRRTDEEGRIEIEFN